MFLFFAFVLALSCLLHAFVGVRLTGPLEGGEHTAVARAIWAALALHAIFFPLAVGQMPNTGKPWADTAQFVGWTTGGLFSLLVILMLFKDGAWLALKAWSALAPDTSPLPSDPSRRAFLQTVANAGVAVATAAVGTAAIIGARLRPTVERISLPVDTLPESLRGLRIVQISDIHVGPTIRRGAIETLVAEVQSLKPDIIAVTGDLVDGSVAALTPHVAPLKELSAPLGTWFVTGNHEYYSGAKAWCEHCAEQLGMKVLLDEHAVVQHKGAEIVIAGVADLHASRIEPSHESSPTKAFAGSPPGDFRLLLAHQPESILATEGLGVHLQLSGHTHGGQYFPFTWLIRLVKRWSRGLHRVGDSWLYVNRGTTYWGPPMRLDSQQEITLIELA
jgi:hypothetical protein